MSNVINKEIDMNKIKTECEHYVSSRASEDCDQYSPNRNKTKKSATEVGNRKKTDMTKMGTSTVIRTVSRE